VQDGAVAFTISGSGPAMFAFCDSDAKAQKIAMGMQKIYNKHDIRNSIYSGKIKLDGTTLIQE
jgi:homoserine kinase